MNSFITRSQRSTIYIWLICTEQTRFKDFHGSACTPNARGAKKGRVLFQPTSEYVEEEESEMPSPLSTDMEIVSQAAIRTQNKPVNVLSNKGIIRKKSTPYKQCDPLPLRAKTKAPDSKEDDEVTVIGEVKSPMEQTPKSSEQNNYELLLQQQKLFLQWQHNDENPSQAQDSQIQMYDMQPASPAETSPNTQVTIRRLSDYKVQELKNECKKRQLPVSVEFASFRVVFIV
ncbi:hypothetical protein ANCDUO_06538 [Ancylostoma duodenale]|uniref:Uncharacterized protein n=1 Tax=Ancylostoma duodenale TaxID=51022 RepID=A0A0C2DKR9_9BILA|nr:hypothetical protein ANCDUO_06538 [Ancylostoma duodenale]